MATGASTAGVRIPPRTLPLASSTYCSGAMLVVSSRGAVGGGVPRATQRSRCAIAARSTNVCGPVLIGESQVKFGLGWFVGCSIESNHAATDARSPVSVAPRSQAVLVEVRGARDLPEPVCGLSGWRAAGRRRRSRSGRPAPARRGRRG